MIDSSIKRQNILLTLWKFICTRSIKDRVMLLCKIFVIGLLLQFFLQTYITYKLNRSGGFRTLFRMWKEFILLIFVVILLRYIFCNLKKRILTVKNKYNVESVSIKLIRKEIKNEFLTKFILLFIVTLLIFFVLAVLIQNVGLNAFILSFKYDLMGFFIFGIGICLSLAFFTEKDKDLFEFYRKLISISLRLGLFFRFIIWLMPNILKLLGFNPNSFEGTVGQEPPAAYYTKITSFAEGSHVRNSYLFERPTSFGFWLIAFFPVFVLGYLRKKSKKDQILPTIAFGLLVFSTRSRAGLAIWVIEAIFLFFVLYWKSIKRYLGISIVITILGLGGIAYLSRGMMVREHSNTGHLVLMKAGLDLAYHNLISGRGAGYSGPASHQLCYTDEAINIYSDVNSISLENKRCETIRKINVENQISTYGFNPEDQYIQILMEYGIFGLLFRLALCLLILRYTIKIISNYNRKTKSPYQEFLYYSLIGFSIGFIGLLAEGLVLHSLVDRMIIYPFFLLYGITLGLWEKEKNHQYTPIETIKKKKKHKKPESKGKKK